MDSECHQGEPQEYSTVVAQKEMSNLTLAVREAILIEKQMTSVSMNDRFEQGRGGGLIRIQPHRVGVT